mmetsp:Transcript_37387/g.99578  ORF Transcript_37387/g.99578 Transcript_37387/m.99578 type:complete len:257 (+) Transcript_37387:1714-2484(+)
MLSRTTRSGGAAGRAREGSDPAGAAAGGSVVLRGSAPQLRAAALVAAAWRNLGGRLGGEARWTGVRLPALVDVEVLRGWAGLPEGTTVRRWLLEDVSQRTTAERGDGTWGPPAVGLEPGSGARVEDLVAAYDRDLLPARTQSSTRCSYWRTWRFCLTWGVAWNALDRLVPMSVDTLKAITYSLVDCDATPGSITQCTACSACPHHWPVAGSFLHGREDCVRWPGDRAGLRNRSIAKSWSTCWSSNLRRWWTCGISW